VVKPPKLPGVVKAMVANTLVPPVSRIIEITCNNSFENTAFADVMVNVAEVPADNA
jgi:hypothetical protein